MCSRLKNIEAGVALPAVVAALELVLRKVLKMYQPDIGF